MTLQQTIAQTRIDADQRLRFAVADIGNALYTTNKEEVQKDWVKENYPDVALIDIQVVLTLKGIHIEHYRKSFVMYPSEAVYKLLTQ